MNESEVCPTEDAIQAFLDYLVDPMLPAKSSLRDTPSHSHQQSVAKQVHAVVLLYNYYLRKRQLQLEVLGFEAFCKLAVILKPTLLAHMKLMQRSNDTELDDLDKQFSLTEKTIMEACDISTSLDASKDIPNIERWPISKVAVFLFDSKKENCFLLFSSITQGVWSVIEKDLDISNLTLEVMTEAKQVDKKKRFIRKPSKGESSVDESGLLQLAYLAVNEATGINQSDLLVLESHAVYSLSKEKISARFYIMRCTQSVNEDVIQVPVKDVIESLQGPLVRKSSSRWMVTPVVEYFHVLPYAEIVSTWLSREVLSGSLHSLSMVEGNSNVNSPDRTEKPCTPEIHKSRDRSHIEYGLVGGFGNKAKNANTESFKLKDDSECHMIGLSGELNGSLNMNADDSFMFPSQNGEKCKNIANTIQVDNCEEKTNKCMGSYLNGSPNNAKVKSFQQRHIEDEIAQCDRKIQKILNGGEDDLVLKLESIVEGCNDVCLRSITQERTYQQLEDQHSSQNFKRKRLSEAVLSIQNPCQELDSVCYENNWILPTYHVSTSDGGFKACVTVKGVDFESSGGGNLCTNPREARESAAAELLAKLRRMAGSTM
ncbi:uncharacterized protein LOC133878610 isoform X2 [Alnus glutinosa]|uniref:uncharacterized protein LOC133878610 isoform X2 n=1 Tax=Alnus glutinosa TaxID=3517 RepID=UPI002D773AD1|nr:uncharacterized protein LOC133878610 isoform X2 [Alnus glutinosa]